MIVLREDELRDAEHEARFCVHLLRALKKKTHYIALVSSPVFPPHYFPTLTLLSLHNSNLRLLIPISFLCFYILNVPNSTEILGGVFHGLEEDQDERVDLRCPPGLSSGSRHTFSMT